jgi:hypothetical protein
MNGFHSLTSEISENTEASRFRRRRKAANSRSRGNMSQDQVNTARSSGQPPSLGEHYCHGNPDTIHDGSPRARENTKSRPIRAPAPAAHSPTHPRRTGLGRGA